MHMIDAHFNKPCQMSTLFPVPRPLPCSDFILGKQVFQNTSPYVSEHFDNACI